MEDKHKANGIYRHRLAKDTDEGADSSEENDGDSKHIHGAEAKGERTPPPSGAKNSGHFDRSEEKDRIGEIQQDIEADIEFEALKLTPTTVAPKVAASKFARNFVKGFKM